MTVGELIRAERKKKGWTQSELAERLGISYVGVAQWENGSRNPKLETRQRIAVAMDIDLVRLMNSEEEKELEERYGPWQQRVKDAAAEIQKAVAKKAEEAEACGGTVTSTQRKEWSFYMVAPVANRHYVCRDDLIDFLGLEAEDGKPQISEDDFLCELTSEEIDAVLKAMNAKGHASVLRIARELAQIPDYKKV